MQTTALTGFALSAQQARLWSFLAKNPAYRAHYVARLEGVVELPLLLQAYRRIVQRHEILRTLYHTIPGMELPLQIVTGQAQLQWSIVDLTHLSTTQQYAQNDLFYHWFCQEDFALSQGPLLHVWIISLSTTLHLLYVSLPALCADGETLQQSLYEFLHEYQANQPHQLPAEEPIQYIDVLAWQDEIIHEEDATAQKQYWKERDLSPLSRLRFPWQTVSPPPEGAFKRPSSFCPRHYPLHFSQECTDQLYRMAQQHTVSLQALLLAGWKNTISRFTGEEDILIGVACNGRIDEELTHAFGLYTRYLPFSTPGLYHLPLHQIALLIDALLKEAEEKQLHFSWPTKNDAQAESVDYFPVCFEYQSWPRTIVQRELSVTVYQRYSCSEPFMLKFCVYQDEETLQLVLSYDASCVHEEQVQQLASAVSTLLESALAHPQCALEHLPILTHEPMANLCTEKQGGLFLHQHVEKQASKTPERLAVISGNEALTYQELNARVNHLALLLRRQGVGPNAYVGLCVTRSLQMIIGLLAILKAGGAYVPLDPESPIERLQYQLRDVRAHILLTQRSLLARLAPGNGRVLCLEDLEDLEQPAAATVTPVNEPGDIAYVIYTSGSTGLPKGVIISHRNIINYTRELCQVLEVESGWHFATVSTLAADLGNTSIFCSLASGGCIQVLDYATITSREAFLDWHQRHPIDVLKIVPSHLSALLSGEPTPRLLPRKALILGGEALSVQFINVLQAIGGSCRIFNHYGPTEATIGVLVNSLGELRSPEDRAQGDATRSYHTVPLGRSLANTQTYILDRGGQLVPSGVNGALYLGGVSLALGYLHQAEQTAERFLPHPFSSQPGERLYYTGDIVRTDATGEIEFVGRFDHQVKIRGFRIEPGEIEVVLRQHPDVWDSVVVLHKDHTDAPQLIAYIVLNKQSKTTLASLRNFAERYLPDAMLPALFVFLDALPLTNNGKVDRKRLPDPAQIQPDHLPVAPRSFLEEQILEIWQEILKDTHPGIHDNFFHLGGHSLLATQLIARLYATLRVEISVLNLFEAPTIAELAQVVTQKLSEEQYILPALTARTAAGNVITSFAQQRLWLMDQLEPGSTAYLVPRVRRINGILNPQALQESYTTLLQRHEILRTTFDIQEGKPVQVIHPPSSLHLPIIDISALEEGLREKIARQLAQQEARRAFDLRQGPLLRVHLFRLGTTDHVLLLLIHHIITDAWSNELFERELQHCYQAFTTRRPHSLPSLSIQYADFALWQRTWLSDPRQETHLSYWRKQLAGAATLTLPSDHPAPMQPGTRGAARSIRLGTSFHKQLHALSRQEEVTLFMLLLAAFQVILRHYADQEDISIGIPMNNRTHTDLEQVIGLFINTLVLRTDLAGHLTFRELLKRVRTTCLAAYAHQHVPFELLVEMLQPIRHPTVPPLFQVMFMMQNATKAPSQVGDLVFSPLNLANGTAKFDLTLSIVDTSTHLLINMEYRLDIFEPGTIDTLLHRYQEVLERVVGDPTCSIDACISEEITGGDLVNAFNEDLEVE